MQRSNVQMECPEQKNREESEDIIETIEDKKKETRGKKKRVDHAGLPKFPPHLLKLPPALPGPACQRKFNWKLLSSGTIAIGNILFIMPTTHHQVMGNVGKLEAWVLKALGREVQNCSAPVASGVAKIESLFPGVRASIWESYRQKVDGL